MNKPDRSRAARSKRKRRPDGRALQFEAESRGTDERTELHHLPPAYAEQAQLMIKVRRDLGVSER